MRNEEGGCAKGLGSRDLGGAGKSGTVTFSLDRLRACPLAEAARGGTALGGDRA
jgi:hypothetical protein